MPDQPVDPQTVLAQLDAAANGLDKAANKLYRLLPRYEGHEDDQGVFHPGARLRWEELVDGKLAEIAGGYEQREKRPPAKEILEARARAQAKAEDTQLWADVHALAAEISALQKWMSAKRESISARQSWLKAEGVLSGQVPSGRGEIIGARRA